MRSQSRLLAPALTWLLVAPGLAWSQDAVVVDDPVPIALANRPFIRGDANIDMAVDIADAIAVLTFLFPPPLDPQPGRLPCRDAADSNDDEALDVADAVYLLNFLFATGNPPPSPYPDCGLDPPGTSVSDIAGQLTCNSYPSCVDDNDPVLVGHVLRRIAFGSTPALFAQVEATGVEAYILAQLDGTVDDSTNTRLNDLLAGLDSQSNIANLHRSIFARAWLSHQQLREQMTDFWENHFNTYFFTLRNFLRGLPQYDTAGANALATELEGAENATLRALALGSFHDLLLASATGVPMLKYLDSNLNLASAPNENYARELFELHTMGDDNGYDQGDIEEMARCLTGWTFCKKDPAVLGLPLAQRAFEPCLPDGDPTGVWTFHFDSTNHDHGAKAFTLGSQSFSFPALPAGDPGGLQEALTVMQWLAEDSPQTAEFVSTKLVQKFITDDPAAVASLPIQALIADCIGTWLATDGDIREVLEVILTSDPFLDAAAGFRWNLVETPYENVIGNARVLDDGSLSQADEGVMLTRIRTSLSRLGNLPFYWSTPDGYPGFGADQLGTSKLIERIKFSQEIHDGASNDPEFDILGLLADGTVPAEDVAAIVDFFLDRFYQGEVTPEDRQLAIDFLSTDDQNPPQPAPLVATDPDHEDRIRQLVVYIASFPRNLKQ